MSRNGVMSQRVRPLEQISESTPHKSAMQSANYFSQSLPHQQGSLLLLRKQFPVLRSLARCVDMNWLAILVCFLYYWYWYIENSWTFVGKQFCNSFIILRKRCMETICNLIFCFTMMHKFNLSVFFSDEHFVNGQNLFCIDEFWEGTCITCQIFILRFSDFTFSWLCSWELLLLLVSSWSLGVIVKYICDS